MGSHGAFGVKVRARAFRFGYPDEIFQGGEVSGMKSSQGGLTRRSFLKTTGTLAGAAVVAGAVTPSLQAYADEYALGQIETEQEQVFCGVCRGNCSGTCKINLHVVDGKIVKTSRRPFNSFPDMSIDRICLRGLS